jgi:hypothetical protein
MILIGLMDTISETRESVNWKIWAHENISDSVFSKKGRNFTKWGIFAAAFGDKDTNVSN